MQNNCTKACKVTDKSRAPWTVLMCGRHMLQRTGVIKARPPHMGTGLFMVGLPFAGIVTVQSLVSILSLIEVPSQCYGDLKAANNHNPVLWLAVIIPLGIPQCRKRQDSSRVSYLGGVRSGSKGFQITLSIHSCRVFDSQSLKSLDLKYNGIHMGREDHVRLWQK